ncbi:MAG: T9SS type A sorting domain-containing protein [Muribaculaceae bacterium]|nr:T9SS type A sorting domain-containing protein [Muribaculaceae bacterium]
MTNRTAQRALKAGLRSAAIVMAVMFCGTTPASAMPEAKDGARVEVVAQPQIKVANGQVEIYLPGDEPKQVAVYALTGQQVKSVTVQPGTTVIELRAGYYIVKCDRLSQRVIVR